MGYGIYLDARPAEAGLFCKIRLNRILAVLSSSPFVEVETAILNINQSNFGLRK